MNRLTEREAQAKLVNDGDESEFNPINDAATYPCRHQTLSFFFQEEDGVEIVQDLDWEGVLEPKVYYFQGEEKIELKEGALYEWAMEKWEED